MAETAARQRHSVPRCHLLQTTDSSNNNNVHYSSAILVFSSHAPETAVNPPPIPHSSPVLSFSVAPVLFSLSSQRRAGVRNNVRRSVALIMAPHVPSINLLSQRQIKQDEYIYGLDDTCVSAVGPAILRWVEEEVVKFTIS